MWTTVLKSQWPYDNTSVFMVMPTCEHRRCTPCLPGPGDRASRRLVPRCPVPQDD